MMKIPRMVMVAPVAVTLNSDMTVLAQNVHQHVEMESARLMNPVMMGTWMVVMAVQVLAMWKMAISVLKVHLSQHLYVPRVDHKCSEPSKDSNIQVNDFCVMNHSPMNKGLGINIRENPYQSRY